MSNSILDSTKKILGIDSSDTSFDVDVLMHINSALSTLYQLGIGPIGGFMIEDNVAVWDDLLHGDKRFNLVKSYIYLKVRILFDPPTVGAVMSAIQDQLKEMEWRINFEREVSVYGRVVIALDFPEPPPVTNDEGLM